MNIIFSENKEHVIVLEDFSDEPLDFTIEEFIAIYGEDALPDWEIKEAIERDRSLKSYYRTFEELCRACQNGTVLRQNFLVHVLDHWSRKLGYKPMSDEMDMKKLAEQKGESYIPGHSDMKTLIHLLHDRNSYERMLRRIKKYSEQGVARSIKELVIEVHRAARNKKSS